jgi:protein dithiol oxidoreductase (disulfide-forming)
MRLTRRLLLLVTLLAALGAGFNAAAQQAGKDYLLIKPPQPVDSGKRIEVLEFFWYGCPHCNNLQPPLKNWLKRKPADVEFRRMPAVLSESWIPLTKAFYALEALGLTDKLHDEVFAAIHEHKVRLQDPRVLFDWVPKHGVDRQKFMDTYNSFGVQSRVQRAIEITRNHEIPGTPAVVVDGKYLTAPSMTLKPDNSIDYARYFQVLDQVIAMARTARGGK